MSDDVVHNNHKLAKTLKPQMAARPDEKGIIMNPPNDTSDEEEDWNAIDKSENKQHENADANDDKNATDAKDNRQDYVQPFAYYNATLEDDGSIKFDLLPTPKLMPPSLHSFISEVGNVENAIRALSPQKEKPKLMQELLGIARAGGTTTYFTLASSGLEQMKAEMIISIGNKIKYKYLIYYGKCAIAVVVTCLLVLGCLQFVSDNRLGMMDLNVLKNALFMQIGTAMGAWLTFAIQKREVTFQELRVLNDHATSTKVKLAVIMLISLCLFMLFITGFLNLKIGEQFSTDQLKKGTGRNFAFVLGAMIGLSESKIGITLTSKIETFMAKI